MGTDILTPPFDSLTPPFGYLDTTLRIRWHPLTKTGKIAGFALLPSLIRVSSWKFFFHLLILPLLFFIIQFFYLTVIFFISPSPFLLHRHDITFPILSSRRHLFYFTVTTLAALSFLFHRHGVIFSTSLSRRHLFYFIVTTSSFLPHRYSFYFTVTFPFLTIELAGLIEGAMPVK